MNSLDELIRDLDALSGHFNNLGWSVCERAAEAIKQLRDDLVLERQAMEAVARRMTPSERKQFLGVSEGSYEQWKEG